MGVDFALVSMLDILRDPRWGRSEECYGEDPYLCGQNAAAAVKGCASAGLEVVAKHFCAQGETTGGVNASAARIGEREPARNSSARDEGGRESGCDGCDGSI